MTEQGRRKWTLLRPDRRQRILLFIIAIVAGFGVVWIGQLTLFQRSGMPQGKDREAKPQAAVLENSPSSTKGSAFSGIGPGLQFSACENLYDYVCSLRSRTDPTGVVRHEASGEARALRWYRQLIRQNPGLSVEEIDEKLVSKIYSRQRVQRVQKLFVRVQQELVEFLGTEIFRTLPKEEAEFMRNRALAVRLELPPPASVYKGEPDLFTRNEVFYERTPQGLYRIRIGGGLLLTVNSRFNLAFTLAHEMAHAIDPCEVKALGRPVEAYSSLVSCVMPSLGSQVGHSTIFSWESQCSSSGILSEVFADWVATHVVARILSESAPLFSREELLAAIFNSVRDLCFDDVESSFQAHEEGAEKSAVANPWSSDHPDHDLRVNEIFARHPTIRRLLGCGTRMAPWSLHASTFCLNSMYLKRGFDAFSGDEPQERSEKAGSHE